MTTDGTERTNQMIRILLVDDHVLFREGLVSLLVSKKDLKIVGEASSVSEAIAQARKLKPDLILMDFGLPDGTGLEAAQTILAEQPETKIVFLTVYEDDERLFAAIRSGAVGFLPKSIPVARLLTYLRRVGQGDVAMTPALTTRILQEFSHMTPQPELPSAAVADLTERELQVLGELETGATNQEIAQRLFITERTVKNHVSHILSKLKLSNRKEAADMARRTGLSANPSSGDGAE